MKQKVGNFLTKVGIMPAMKSERLVYRKFGEDDWEDYYKHISNPVVMRYIGDGPLKGEAAQEKFEKVLMTNRLKYAYGFFGVWKNDDHSFVGLAKFDFMEKGKAEVGYALLPEHWGNGYATEMLEAMINYAGQLGGIRELYGLVDPDNPQSRKVLLKFGFKLHERGYFEDKRTDFYKLNI